MVKRILLLYGMLYASFFHAMIEKPMVVVIPSYNNAQWYKGNLDSVCFQNYTNYRIIYVDDCSIDGTGDLVQSYIDRHTLHDKVTLIRNETNRGALYNLYTHIHQCADHEIIITLDGDDRLKHNDVLQGVNVAYQNGDVWLTYGQYETYPDGERGICRPIAPQVVSTKSYRKHEWVTSHMRTFYAGLFKLVKRDDLMHEGELFRVTWDLAFMLPMLEMANGKFSFIPDILYVYNKATPLNDFKLRLNEQIACEHIIRNKPMYAPVETYIAT